MGNHAEEHHYFHYRRIIYVVMDMSAAWTCWRFVGPICYNFLCPGVHLL